MRIDKEELNPSLFAGDRIVSTENSKQIEGEFSQASGSNINIRKLCALNTPAGIKHQP